MLTILRVVDQHRFAQKSTSLSGHVRDTINRDAFKVIYVYVLHIQSPWPCVDIL